MKQKLAKAIGCLFFLAIGAFLTLRVAYALKPDQGHRDPFPGFYAEEKNSLDIVSIGGSNIRRYIDNPFLYELTGLTSYNVVESRMAVEAYPYLLKEIRKTQTPKLTIIGTRGYIRYHGEEGEEEREKNLRWTTDNMDFSLNRWAYINSYLDTLKQKLEMMFDIVTFHDNWQNVETIMPEYADNREKSPLKGWTVVKKVEKTKKLKTYEETPFPLLEGAKESLDKFLEVLKGEEGPFLFVLTPYHLGKKAYRRSLTVKETIKAAGFDILDFNEFYEELDLDPETEFYDKNHVNALGARKVTKFLADYLEEHYGIVPEHTEEQKQEWEAAVQLEHEIMGLS